MTDPKLIHEALKYHFGFDTFKETSLRLSVIFSMAVTYSCLCPREVANLCYQLPALMSEGTAIIISPLIALMKNQVDALRNFSEEDHVAHFMELVARQEGDQFGKGGCEVRPHKSSFMWRRSLLQNGRTSSFSAQ